MINRGEYKHLIEIWTRQNKQVETDLGFVDVENELGDKDLEPVKITSIFAKIEPRVGGLLTGRQADTVMAKVTHKITFPFSNFRTRLQASKHWIIYSGIRYDIEYQLPDLDEIEAQVFVSERT